MLSAPPAIYALSLHDALPISNDEDVDFEEASMLVYKLRAIRPDITETKIYVDPAPWGGSVGHAFSRRVDPETLERVDSPRSEEHTSELQSQSNLVCRLLLEKK